MSGRSALDMTAETDCIAMELSGSEAKADSEAESE